MNLRLDGISKYFGDVVACDNVSLEVYKNEFFFILGPSGCGKSTLLKTIAGILEPDKGTIEFNERRIDELPANERPMNMVFQSYSLFPHLTVYNNIAFGLKMKNTFKEEIKTRVLSVLKLFRLEDLENRKPDQISGGQQQRVALARAIINKPQILLLEEPLSALDEKLRFEMESQLKILKKQFDSTFIYVTHNQNEALSMADRIAIMNKGKIEQIDTPYTIYNNPKSKFVAEFIGDINFIPFESVQKIHNQLVFQTKEKITFYANNLGLNRIERLLLAVRPEKICIDGSPSIIKKAENCISGVVRDIVFKGITTTFIVVTQSGLNLKVTDSNKTLDTNYQINDPVYLSWKKENSIVIEEE